MTPVNIGRVAKLVEENPHVTYDEIEAETLLHPPSIKEILPKELKIASRWVPHQLTDAQKKKRALKILYDNARPHVHQNVNNYLKEHGISTIEHPPYSPDLLPYWAFRRCSDTSKRHLIVNTFMSMYFIV